MTTPSNPPAWTFPGFREGAWTILPLMPGLFAFGLAFGTVAARKGFSLLDALAMSASVYAGVAQLVALETWPDQLTLPVIGGIVLVTALISSRFLLIGASLRPWLGSQPAGKIYPALFLLVEPNWLMSMRYRANGGSDPAYLLGGGVVIYLVWIVSTAAGYALGTSIGESAYFRHRHGDAGVLHGDADLDVARPARLVRHADRRRRRHRRRLHLRRHVVPDRRCARGLRGGRLHR